jgi:hypothetical protein
MIVKNNKYQKEWHNATKPLKKNEFESTLSVDWN